MEAWAKQLHFCLASSTPHCLDGIEIRRLQYLPFYLLHPCFFILNVNNVGKVTMIVKKDRFFRLKIRLLC